MHCLTAVDEKRRRLCDSRDRSRLVRGTIRRHTNHPFGEAGRPNRKGRVEAVEVDQRQQGGDLDDLLVPEVLDAGPRSLVLTVRGKRTTELVAVLPAHASDPVVRHPNGTTTTLTSHNGVATTVVQDTMAAIMQDPTAIFEQHTTITYRIGDRTMSITVTRATPPPPRP